MNLSRRRVVSSLLSFPLLGSCGQPGSRDVERPLAFGYFGSSELQLTETRDHVNFHFIMGWGGRVDTINLLSIAQSHSKKIVLGCLDWWNDENFQAETFKILQSMGLLKNIWCLYPIDEPDVAGKTEVEVVTKNARLRELCSQFPELNGVKLGVIYGPNRNYPGSTSYDILGFDHYGSDIFQSGEFDDFRSRLRPEQTIWLVPGGADPWRELPVSFVQASNTYVHQIIGIVPFIWIDNSVSSDWGPAGIRSNPTRESYIALGKKILAAGEPAW